MNLINTDIIPDPYDPQTGDVYEFGDPFVQRLVVEDAPTRDDPRVRYRIDGGVDSNLTTVAQFHRHLAGLTRLRGVGRVRGVDPVAGDLMRGAATTIVEQAAALDGVACREAQPPGIGCLVERRPETLAENERDIGAFRTALRLPFDATYEDTVSRAGRLAEHEARTSRSAITDDIAAHFTVSSLKEALRIPDATDEKAIKWATYIANRHDFTGAEFDAVIRTIEEPAHERLTWIARFNGGLAGASITLDGRTEFVTGKRAKALAEALDPRQHHVKTLREQIANLETSLRACEADLNAIRCAYLDVNGTTATITEIVGSLRGSCEMQTRIMNLEAIVSDRESTIAMMAERRLLPSEPDDIEKVARVNALCPPGWHVAMARSGIVVFRPQEVVPMATITGGSVARIVAEIWRWHMQPTVARLAEFQEGLADILGWSVPQLHDPSGASDMLTAVAGLIAAAKEAQ